MTGPLIRPIQKMHSFGGDETLGEPWGTEEQADFERIVREDKAKGIEFLQQRHRRGWRYCFSGPTGPQLNAVGFLGPFARLLCWGLRTDKGL